MNIAKSTPWRILVLLATAFFAGPLWAWEVESLQGEAWIEEGANRIPLTLKSQAADGALVATGSGARLVLREGGSVLRLGAKTKMRVRAMNSTGNALELVYGKLRANVKPDPAKGFRIETRAAVSGVRGTEYFVQSDDTHDFICTLEGLVEVESKITGQKVLVPPRAGVEIAPGKSFTVQPTADELVDAWVSETSAAGAPAVVTDGYRDLPSRFHSAGGDFLYAVRVNALFGRTDHVGYNSAGSKDHNWFSQYRLTPALYWGKTWGLAWEPRLLWHASDERMILDSDPLVTRTAYARAALGELYGDAAFGPLLVRVGEQAVQWNDGVFLSSDSWRLDPYLLRALRARAAWNGHYLDVLASRRGDGGELDGEVRAGIVAFKYDFRNWFSVIAAERSPESRFGRRVDEALVQSTRRIGPADYHATLWHQSGGFNMWEGGLGAYPWNGQALRAGVSALHADPDFIAGLEPVYSLGYSRTFERSNLRQYRAKISAETGGWNLFFEWIHSQSVGRSHLVKWSGRLRDLMSEQDFGASRDLRDGLKLLLVGFRTQPTSAMSESSPVWPKRTGYGVTASLQFIY